jgi:hypothetical protein
MYQAFGSHERRNKNLFTSCDTACLCMLFALCTITVEIFFRKVQETDGMEFMMKSSLMKKVRFADENLSKN